MLRAGIDITARWVVVAFALIVVGILKFFELT